MHMRESNGWSDVPSFSRIWAESVNTTTPIKIQANPKRLSLLIQNLSANTLYVMSSSGGDTSKSIQVVDEYETENQGELFLLASAVSDVRLEEVCQG